MTQHVPPHALSLFDLLARSWDLGPRVCDLRFNVLGSSVMVTLADGTLAFLPTADAEDPETRMRTELETGRMTIRPREKAPAAPVRSEALASPDHASCPVAQQGFAFVHRDGDEIWRATAKGQTLRVARATGAGVTALAALPDKRGLLVARGAALAVVSPEDGLTVASTVLAHPIQRLAVAPDAGRIACWGAGQVTVLAAADLAPGLSLPVPGDLLGLAWSPDGRWLVGGAADEALVLVDLGTGAADRIVDFPAPVASVGFSAQAGAQANAQAGALLAAGAFRTVGWRLPDLPFGGHEGTPIETGKPGLTLVERVAPHPTRDLCAVGYANGLVTLCQIGTRDEMLLREGRGAAVTALAWSPDGTHLALGTAEGTAAIATFPKHLLK